MRRLFGKHIAFAILLLSLLALNPTLQAVKTTQAAKASGVFTTDVTGVYGRNKEGVIPNPLGMVTMQIIAKITHTSDNFMETEFKLTSGYFSFSDGPYKGEWEIKEGKGKYNRNKHWEIEIEENRIFGYGLVEIHGEAVNTVTGKEKDFHLHGYVKSEIKPAPWVAPVNYFPPENKFGEYSISTQGYVNKPNKPPAILFDESHDERIYLDPTDPNNHEIAWGFSQWRDYLQSKGYKVDKNLNSPITLQLLEQYSVLVIAMPRVAFTTDEIAAINAFVSQGGGLFVIGEYDIAAIWGPYREDDYRMNAIIQYYGISFTTGCTSWDTITTINTHPVTTGISSYQVWDAGNLTVSSPAVWLAKGVDKFDPSKTIITLAASNYGLGRVVVATDTNTFADWNGGMTTADDAKLAENIAEWLYMGIT